VLRLGDAWVWDSWYFDDGESFHAFYLKASRALLDPDRRHHRASIGHAVSRDLTRWTEVADALVAGDGPAFDDLATWTGSTIRDPEGRYHLFYTGIGREFGDRMKRIGHAVSDDLYAWVRVDVLPIVADGTWYETYALLGHEPWRDPWVFYDEDTNAWRMLVTASSAAPTGAARGCVGTAVSTDLMSWQVAKPLTEPAGFHQFEVPQTLQVDGSCVLVWCMRDIDVDASARHDAGAPLTGTWTAPADSLGGPFHLDRAEPIQIEGTYAGRVVPGRDVQLHLLAFADTGPDSSFGGYLTDPVPLRLTGRGALQPRV
jgi:beta-fructofuranosidase